MVTLLVTGFVFPGLVRWARADRFAAGAHLHPPHLVPWHAPSRSTQTHEVPR